MRFLTLLLSLLVITGCLSSYHSNHNSVAIANNTQFELIPTIPFDNGLVLTQSATITYNDESHDLIFKTEILQNKLTMVGLTPTGTRIFTISMQQGAVNAQGFSSLVENIKPEYILADLQLSLWPLQEITAATRGATILQPNQLSRQVTRQAETLITITYSEPTAYQGTIEFTHLERGYSLVLSPLAVELINHD